jgi:hypothetical protein
VPPPEFFEKDAKNCVILEDYEANKKDENLSKLFRITSSHCNTTVILLYQSFTRTPPLFRRLCDVYIIYRLHDDNEMDIVAKRVGIPKQEFLQLFDTFCKNKYDNICIDLSPNSPAKLRLNVFTPIKKINKLSITNDKEQADNDT